MKYVLVRTKPKDSFTLVVSDNSTNFQTTVSPPLYLQANRDYELAMVNLETYYSFANVRKDNNSFKWNVESPEITRIYTWKERHYNSSKCQHVAMYIDYTLYIVYGE